MDKLEQSDFLFYRSKKDGKIIVRVAYNDNDIWATQKGMSIIFNTSRENITIHLKNIFNSGELDKDSVCKKILHTAEDGKDYPTLIYNLNTIISLGYRVNSYEATRFRIWATGVIREYLQKGFVIDDERLKHGSKMFGEDYFSELLERIREIRASERRFYQKITDLYRDASYDYDKNSPHTKLFYKIVQNKLLYEASKHTAPELIKLRADSTKPNMGLTTWSAQKDGGKIIVRDIIVSKNYLFESEVKTLNRIVSMFLDFAENLVERRVKMSMADWVRTLDDFLQFNRYDVLEDAGKIRKDIADKFAKKEFEIFRKVQDENFESDFDKIALEINQGNIPTANFEDAEIVDEEKPSTFNQNLKKSLNYNPKSKENKKGKKDK